MVNTEMSDDRYSKKVNGLADRPLQVVTSKSSLNTKFSFAFDKTLPQQKSLNSPKPKVKIFSSKDSNDERDFIAVPSKDIPRN